MSFAGSTQPGDGEAVRVVVGAPSWKEKVIGYAKKSRGIMLRRVRRAKIKPSFISFSDFGDSDFGGCDTMP